MPRKVAAREASVVDQCLWTNVYAYSPLVNTRESKSFGVARAIACIVR